MEHLQDIQGGDITAADMILPEQEPSEIQEFFKGKTVFLTGATGFLGKLVLEKLLRSCGDIEKIYILIRPKKDKDPNTRMAEIFDSILFEKLKRDRPRVLQKVIMMAGDCEKENLGLSDEDMRIIVNEVNCIFHVAATVRFNESLKKSTHINVRSVRDLVVLSKKIKDLKSFVYISTAYSNCTRSEVDETFYPQDIEGLKLLNVIESLPDSYLDNITEKLLGDFPNTYVFTKAMAEDVIKNLAKDLPVAIVRPSIVIATSQEPVAGWIDNIYGPTGMGIGASLGVIRAVHADEEKISDMVPADHVVNTMICAAWHIATVRSINENRESDDDTSTLEKKFEKEIPIYNYVSGTDNPMTWGRFMQDIETNCKKVKSPLIMWHHYVGMYKNRYIYLFFAFLLHYLPGYLVDFVATLIGKKPIMVKSYKKIDKFGSVISYFSMRQWKFRNGNTKALWNRLKETDKILFGFDMVNFDWNEYFYTYVRGVRVYLLKDPLDTIPAGERKYIILAILHYVLLTFVFLLLFKFVWFLFGGYVVDRIYSN